MAVSLVTRRTVGAPIDAPQPATSNGNGYHFGMILTEGLEL